MIFDFLLFIFLLFILFYFPGRFLLHRVGHSSQMSIATAFCVGIGFFLISTYLLSFINLSHIYIFLVSPLFFIEVSGLKINVRKISGFRQFMMWEYFLILLGSSYMTYIMWNSGTILQEQLVFYGVNSVDAIWHLSLIGNLSHQFPPSHPGLSEVPLHGYNFFYDFMVAQFLKLYHFSVLDLFFRYFTIFISLLYGLTALSFAHFLQMKRSVRLTFLYLLYFASGFGFIFSFFTKHPYDPGIVHTSSNIVDPSVILSITLLFSAYILLFSIKRNIQIILPALILGILPMIKIYTALLAIAGLCVIAIKNIRSHRIYFIGVCLTGIIGAVTYLPFNFGSGKLIFAPFLLFQHYMQSSSFLLQEQWYLKYLTYKEHNNYLRMTQFNLQTIAVFLLPSLGLRLVSIMYVKNLFRKEFYSDRTIFWFVAILLGLFIPTFFIQSIAVFVVIQFFWVVYFLLIIPTSYALVLLLGKITPVKILLYIVLLIGLSIPYHLSMIPVYSANPLALSKDFLDITDEIKKISKNQGLFIVNVVHKGNTVENVTNLPLVSALTSHDVFYEPEVLEFLHLDATVDERKNLVADADAFLTTCDNQGIIQILRKTKNTFLMTIKDYSCDIKSGELKKVKQSGQYSLYKI